MLLPRDTAAADQRVHTHTLVVNTDALTSQNSFLFHFIYPGLSDYGGGRREERKGEDEGDGGSTGAD